MTDGPPADNRVTKTLELVLHGPIPPTDSFRVRTTIGTSGVFQLCPAMDNSQGPCQMERLYQNAIINVPGKPFDYVFERYDRQTDRPIAQFGAGHDIDEHNSTIAGVYTYPP